jgi:hypothetical protein
MRNERDEVTVEVVLPEVGVRMQEEEEDVVAVQVGAGAFIGRNNNNNTTDPPGAILILIGAAVVRRTRIRAVIVPVVGGTIRPPPGVKAHQHPLNIIMHQGEKSNEPVAADRSIRMRGIIIIEPVVAESVPVVVQRRRRRQVILRIGTSQER